MNDEEIKMGISTMFGQEAKVKLSMNSIQNEAIYSKNKSNRKNRYLNGRLSTWNIMPNASELIMIILIILLFSNKVNAGSCSSSQTTDETVKIRSFEYTGCTKTIIYNYAQCSDYSCYYLMGTITTGAQDYVYLEKDINSDTQTWSKFYLGAPAAYSFAMDRDQSSIYYILNDSGTHLYFLSINTTNGALIFAYEDSSLSYMCNSDYCRVAISDNNKIYLSIEDSSNNGYICIYSTGSLSCYQTTNCKIPYSMISISGPKLYISSQTNTQAVFKLVNMSSFNVQWKNLISCTGNCNAYIHHSCLNSDKTVVYTISNLDSYLYLTGFYVSTGAVYSNRYKSTSNVISSIYVQYRSKSVYITMADSSSKYCLFILTVETNSVSSYKFASGITLYSISYESDTQRVVLSGSKSSDSYAYYSKSYLKTIPEISDVSSSVSLLAQTTLSDLSVTLNSGDDIGTSPTTVALSAYTASSTSTTINTSTQSSSTSNASYWLSDIYAYHLTSNIENKVSANLTCLSSGSTTITYTFSSIYGNTVPSWGSINSTSNTLVFSPPAVTQDTTYNFTVATYVSGNVNTYYQSAFIQVDACLVSNCYVCVSGDTSKCSQCNSGYQVYFKDSSCVVSTVSSAAEASTVSTVTLTSIGMASVIATSIISLTSPQGIWISINEFQLLLLLLLTGAYFPSNISYYLTGVSFSSFSFNFIPVIKSPGPNYLKSWLDFNLNNDYLSDIGLNSGSSVINNFSLFTTILLQIGLHLVFILVFFRLLNKCYKKHPKLLNLRKHLHRIFTLSIYIRTLLEANQFLLICSIYEISLAINKSASRICSLVVAHVIFIFCIKLMIWTGIIIYKSIRNKLDLKLASVFGEIFEGVKDTKLAKLYTLIHIVRRTFLVLLFIFGDSVNLTTKLIILVVFQLLCCIYKISVRPIKETKDCFIEIINEILFLSLSSLLFRFNSSSSWIDSAEYGFIGSITAVNFLTSIIYIVAFIKTIIIAIKNCKKRKINNYRITKDQVSKDVKEDIKSNNTIVQLKDNTKPNNKDPKLVIIDFAEPSYNIPMHKTPQENRFYCRESHQFKKSNENNFSKVLAEESKTQYGFFKQAEASFRNGGIFHRKMSE